MSIDLPPALPPDLEEPAVLEERREREGGQSIEVEVGSERIVVSGNTYLPAQQFHELTQVVSRPAQFILLLKSLYEAQGYHFVNIEYARDPASRDIYVHVNEGRLAQVDAPPLLAPFFERFRGVRDRSRSHFETRRLLAETKAQRAGQEIASGYRVDPNDPERYTLVLESEPDPEHDVMRYSAGFGNPGNRFLGRYFGSTNLRYSTRAGNAVGFDYTRGFPSLGVSRGGERYDRYGLSYSTVSRFGLYNLSAGYTSFETRDRFGADEDARSRIVSLRMDGSQFLYASGSTRWLIDGRLEYVDSVNRITAVPFDETGGDTFPVAGQRVRDERYAAARIGSTLVTPWRLFGRPGNISLDAHYARGFGGSIDNLINDGRSSNFHYIGGAAELNYGLPAGVIASLSFEGQLAFDREVPQQHQWVLGGADRISAFLPGILVGDSGTLTRLSIRLPRWRLFDRPFLRFSIFAEHGTARFEDRTGSTAPTRAITDYGAKLAFDPADWLDLTLHVSDSISERNVEVFPGPGSIDDNRANVFFSLAIQFGHGRPGH